MSQTNCVRLDDAGIEKIERATQADSLPHRRASDIEPNLTPNMHESIASSGALIDDSDAEADSVAVQVSDGLPLECKKAQALELLCVPAGEAYPVTQIPPRLPHVNGNVSHVDAYFGNVRVSACVDTGATHSLISKEIWQQIKDNPEVVARVGPPRLTMRGANGTIIPLGGVAHVFFKLGNFVYDADVHFGGLNGIDMLLGWDFLGGVGALVNCGERTITIGPQQTIPFKDCTTFEPCYLTTVESKLIPSRHAGCVECRLSGTWVIETPAVITAMVSVQEGVDLVEQVVLPDSSGRVFIVFHNESIDDCEIPSKEIVGTLVPLETVNRQSYGSTVDDLSAAMWVLPEGGTVDVAALYEGSDQASSYWAAEQITCGETSSEVTDSDGELHQETVTFPDAIGSPSERQKDLRNGPHRYAAEHGGGCQGFRLSANARVWDGAGYDTTERCGVPWDTVRIPETGRSIPRAQALKVESGLRTFRKREPSTMAGCIQPGSPITRLPEHLQCTLPIDGGGLSEVELNEAVELILEFADIFVGPDGQVGFTDKIRHVIETPDAKPIKINPRRKSEAEKEHIAAEVGKLLQDGKVVPSQSPWGAPVVLVRKKDGTLRFCIDYRRLNDVTKKDAYPLPRIEECLDALNGAQFFSTMDLASGYWQVAMESESQPKTAFTTHIGLFEWNVMPFGLCNASATFSRLMEQVLTDLCWSRCLVYLDDVLAFGTSFQQALENLRAVFQRFRGANLKLKAKKCEFFRRKVEYLGHRVSGEGIQPSLDKIQGLHGIETPKNLGEVRTFLGFTGYYRRFVKNYSHLAAPLTGLTKKGVRFMWSEDQERAFQSLKEALERAPLLHYVRPKTPFILDTDASDFAIGAALSQIQDGEEVPLAFGSKTLCDSRRKYCTTKRELYAVVYFMRYFQGYIRGAMTHIRTDHSALQWLMRFTGSDAMYHRWIIEMQMYMPWDVKHRPGVQHGNADLLSRIRRDCKNLDCEMCKERFRKNTQCRGTDSEDSELETSAARKVLTQPERAQLALQFDPEEGDDRPDWGDYAPSEADSSRANYGRAWTIAPAKPRSDLDRVMTRSRAKQSTPASVDQQEVEEEQRKKRVLHWKQERAQRCKQVATRQSARLKELQTRRAPVNPSLPPKEQPHKLRSSEVGGRKTS